MISTKRIKVENKLGEHVKTMREYFSQSKEVEFSDATRCFRVNGKSVPGLLPNLKEVFWPEYEYVKPTFKVNKQDQNRKQHSKPKGLKRDVYGGLVRGSIVHNQLRMYANRASIEEFESQYCAIHEYTEKAISALKIWKFIPITGEYALFNASPLNIATAADMICMNESGELVLIEWKTGMDTYFKRGNGPMHGPLQGIYNNCPLNQAYIQLLFTKTLLESELSMCIKHAYVVQINSDGIERYTLPSIINKKRNQLITYFSQKMNFLTTQKKQNKRTCK